MSSHSVASSVAHFDEYLLGVRQPIVSKSLHRVTIRRRARDKLWVVLQKVL